MAVIALLETLPDILRAALRRHLPDGVEMRAVDAADEEQARRLAAEAEALVVWNGPLPSATLAAATAARLVQVCDHRPRGVDFFTARRRGLPVAGPGAAGASSAAEQALLLILAGMRRTSAAADRASLGRDLRGSTVGLLGVDPIARALVGPLEALGASIVYWSDPRRESEPLPSPARPVERFEVLAATDVVSLHLPPTPDSRSAIGRETLRLFRRDALLVNVGAPELIDEVSLYQALANRRLGGAALDGLIEGGHGEPLRSLPGVVVTEAAATRTAEAIDQQAAAAMANVARVLAGQEPLDRWA